MKPISRPAGEMVLLLFCSAAGSLKMTVLEHSLKMGGESGERRRGPNLYFKKINK